MKCLSKKSSQRACPKPHHQLLKEIRRKSHAKQTLTSLADAFIMGSTRNSSILPITAWAPGLPLISARPDCWTLVKKKGQEASLRFFKTCWNLLKHYYKGAVLFRFFFFSFFPGEFGNSRKKLVNYWQSAAVVVAIGPRILTSFSMNRRRAQNRHFL